VRTGAIFRLTLFLIFLANINFAFAQFSTVTPNAEQAEYSYTFTKITAEGKFLVQHLAWRIQSGAYNYDVELEIENEDKGYSPFIRKETTSNYIEESLQPGSYRIRVTPFDVLGHKGRTADWTYFMIDTALEPNLKSFSPRAFYLDEDLNFVLTIYGRLIFDDSEAYLVPHSPRSAAPRIKPARFEAEPSGGRARLYFDKKQLVLGSYDIYLKNPRGFDSLVGTFHIELRKPLEFDISASYTPLIPLVTKEVAGRYFQNENVPFGFLMNINIIPINTSIFDIGIELRGGYSFLYVYTDRYELKGNIWNIDARLLVRWLFPNKTMAINIKAGGGLAFGEFDFTYRIGPPPEPKPSNYFTLSTGVSYMMFFKEALYLEAGADYMHYVAINDLANDYIRPYISAGWRF
jgi:hypothetical protein